MRLSWPNALFVGWWMSVCPAGVLCRSAGTARRCAPADANAADNSNRIADGEQGFLRSSGGDLSRGLEGDSALRRDTEAAGLGAAGEFASVAVCGLAVCGFGGDW